MKKENKEKKKRLSGKGTARGAFGWRLPYVFNIRDRAFLVRFDVLYLDLSLLAGCLLPFHDSIAVGRLDFDCHGLFLHTGRLAHNCGWAESSVGQLALSAFSPHGQAYRLSKANKKIVDVMPTIFWQPGLQCCSCLFWLLGLVPAPEVSNAVDMNVDSDALVPAPRCTHTQVCHLGPHAGKRRQSLDRVRNVRVPLVPQNLGCLLDVFGLEVVEADFADEGIKSWRVNGENRFKIEALPLSVTVRHDVQDTYSGHVILHALDGNASHSVFGLAT